MKRLAPALALLLLLATLVGGVTVLLQLRLAQGDVFPPYSSLRSDPLGTRALHDALAELPDLRVARGYEHLADLPPKPARTMIFAGWPAVRWSLLTREQVDPLEAAVRNGSRLVLVFRAQAAHTEKETAAVKKAKEEAARRKKERKKSDRDDEEIVPEKSHVDLHHRWGVDVKDRIVTGPDTGAARTDDPRAAGLPAQVPWRSELYFDLDAGTGWRTIYRRDKHPVLVERPFGRGTIVLATDSYFLSNEALLKDRAPALLAWIVGDSAEVVFDEAHLGVARDPGIAELARHYGLAGAFFTLLALAGLFVWRRMALFVPPVDDPPELALAYHPAAGLESLLRRAVPVTGVADACLAEWKTTARPADRARVEAAWAALPPNTSAAARYNAAVRALRRH